MKAFRTCAVHPFRRCCPIVGHAARLQIPAYWHARSGKAYHGAVRHLPSLATPLLRVLKRQIVSLTELLAGISEDADL